MIESSVSDPERTRLQTLDVDWRQAWAGQLGGNLRAWPATVAEAAGVLAWTETGEVTVQTAQEPMRATASHRAEQTSEVRSGEWLTRLRVAADWSLVVCEDGYVGWVASWALAPQVERERSEQSSRWLGRYASPRGTLWQSDHWAHSPLWLGQPLLTPVDGARSRGEWTAVELPHGPAGWVPTSEISQGPLAATAQDVVRRVHELLGTPYRWGGRTPGGLDCSGLVQLVWALAGVPLPRDSSQQAQVGSTLGEDPAEWEPGDLIFFDHPATHVALVAGPDSILHARGSVRRDLRADVPDLMARWSGARRVRDLCGRGQETLWSRPSQASSQT